MKFRSGQKLNPLSRLFDTDEDFSASELKTVQLLTSLPKRDYPKPSLRRTYLTLAPTSAPRLSKFTTLSYSFAGALMVLFVFFVSSANKSLPGETLFPLKKAQEQVSNLIITTYTPNPELQIALTMKRVDDAQKILSQTEAPQAAKQAALEELYKQTETAASAIDETKLSTESKKKIVSDLQNITEKQQQIVNEALAETETKDVATKTSEAMSRLISAAGAEEEITKLPESTTKTGVVTEITKDFITIDQNKFKITHDTKFIFGDKSVDFSKISANMKVLVEYKNGVDKQFASVVKVAEETKKPVTKPVEEKSLDSIIEQNRAQTSTGFIPEDPTPECTPATPCGE